MKSTVLVFYYYTDSTIYSKCTNTSNRPITATNQKPVMNLERVGEVGKGGAGEKEGEEGRDRLTRQLLNYLTINKIANCYTAHNNSYLP